MSCRANRRVAHRAKPIAQSWFVSAQDLRWVARNKNDVQAEIGEDAQGKIELRAAFSALQPTEHAETHAKSPYRVSPSPKPSRARNAYHVSDILWCKHSDATRGSIRWRCCSKLIEVWLFRARHFSRRGVCMLLEGGNFLLYYAIAYIG